MIDIFLNFNLRQLYIHLATCQSDGYFFFENEHVARRYGCLSDFFTDVVVRMNFSAEFLPPLPNKQSESSSLPIFFRDSSSMFQPFTSHPTFIYIFIRAYRILTAAPWPILDVNTSSSITRLVVESLGMF